MLLSAMDYPSLRLLPAFRAMEHPKWNLFSGGIVLLEDSMNDKLDLYEIPTGCILG